MTELLVDDLRHLEVSWAPGARNYRARFEAGGLESLRKMIVGLGSLSRGELARERMEVALSDINMFKNPAEFMATRLAPTLLVLFIEYGQNKTKGGNTIRKKNEYSQVPAYASGFSSTPKERKDAVQWMYDNAAVRCDADDRQVLEQLCRYITRPALANERVQTNAAGQVVLKLKTPWRDGTTHLIMSPLEFMQMLAALVPRPLLHLIRFHGVLAPNAKLRAGGAARGRAPAQAAPPAECEANCAHHRPVRLSWAKLLKRVFEIDMEQCSNCGGELKIIAAIHEQPVIEKTLTPLGLQARGPPRAPARGQALQAAWSRPTPTVQATRRHGLLESAASESLRDR